MDFEAPWLQGFFLRLNDYDSTNPISFCIKIFIQVLYLDKPLIYNLTEKTIIQLMYEHINIQGSQHMHPSFHLQEQIDISRHNESKDEEAF